MNKITLLKRNVANNRPLWRWQSAGETINEALQTVFGHLSYTDLCKCMIVSKTWRKMALDELQSRCTVNVRNDNHIHYVMKQLKANSNFRVGRCIITSTSLNFALLNQMLLNLSSTLNVLKIEVSTIHAQSNYSLPKILVSLPNLTHLSVTSVITSTENANAYNDSNNNINTLLSDWPFLNGNYLSCKPESCKIGSSTPAEGKIFVHRGILHLHFDFGPNSRFHLSKIFQVFPNLVELSVTNIVEESRKNLKDFNGQYLRLRSLKSLTLRQYSNIGLPEKLIQTLMKLDMRLEKFMLIFHPPSQSSSSNVTPHIYSTLLKQFIETQGTTLKSLKLIQIEEEICSNICHYNRNKATNSKYSGPSTLNDTPIENESYHWDFNYSSPSLVLFPMSLPNLKTLHLQKPLITNFAQVLKYFPKLEQLSIQVSQGCNWKGMMPQKLEPHQGITAFKLDFIDSESFSRLGHCFPSLQTLELGYCNESLFNALCKQIPYFNGHSAKNNLISCQFCHMVGGQVFSCTNRQQKKKPKEAGTVDASLNKGYGVEHEHGEVYGSSTTFKNLKLLRVRACHHFSYENFVFLQRASRHTEQSIAVSDFGEHTDNDELDSFKGFSWNSLDITKDKKFIDLPLNCAETTESCSSA